MVYFEFILTFVVILFSILAIVGVARPRLRGNKLMAIARSYLPVLAVVLLVRSFIFQPFKVVSGSLEPTVLIGDYLAVNQSAYGLRLPVIHSKIAGQGKPHKGDIALFYFPENPKLVYVKRVIGTPGDHIIYKNKELYINGVKASQQDDGLGFDVEPGMPAQLVQQKIENLNGIKHRIFINNKLPANDIDVVVPANSYFMMGDNRDDSDDSRRWGFVPDKNLIGKAYRILFSWNSDNSQPRMNRIATKL